MFVYFHLANNDKWLTLFSCLAQLREDFLLLLDITTPLSGDCTPGTVPISQALPIKASLMSQKSSRTMRSFVASKAIELSSIALRALP